MWLSPHDFGQVHLKERQSPTQTQTQVGKSCLVIEPGGEPQGFSEEYGLFLFFIVGSEESPVHVEVPAVRVAGAEGS